MATSIAAIGYALSALFFGSLALLLATGWRSRFQSYHLLLAVTGTAAWAGLAAWHAYETSIPLDWVWGAEVVRNMLWVAFLLRLLRPLATGSQVYARILGYVRIGSYILGGLLLLVLADLPIPGGKIASERIQGEFLLLVQLLYSVLGMALVEQLFRNTPSEQRWGIKYMCFGLGVIFAYDFYLYTDALLFHRLDGDIWSARGAVTVLTIPFFAVTAARNPDWSLPVLLSRRMVFHSTTLLGAGIYMLLMALAGYYIRLYGGEWGTVLQITFLFGAIMLLATLLFSGHVRSRVKVFLNKHFFSYRYDYREEWLRLMDLLARETRDVPLNERVIWALSEIVDSPGGSLWLSDGKGQYVCEAFFNLSVVTYPKLGVDHPLSRFMEERQWIVDFTEYEDQGMVYDDLSCPDWLREPDTFWLLVPLIQQNKMIGFVALAPPRAPLALNWENRDLLKTAGMQAASYIALYQAADALADARQFEGFNRLSAFIIHDLKNLIAQLSLVAKNAAKHKHNPEFIDDAISTIENSVSKMNRLMVQLKSADATGFHNAKPLDLLQELNSLLDARKGALPQPVFEPDVKSAIVMAEERLGAVLGHVIQNAVDATPSDGSIRVKLRTSGDHAIVEVVDTGVGMDEDFLQNRLFRPFDSTKGLTGMGIGAYECREVVQAMGGQVNVKSTPGKGTSFQIMLPLHN